MLDYGYFSYHYTKSKDDKSIKKAKESFLKAKQKRKKKK